MPVECMGSVTSTLGPIPYSVGRLAFKNLNYLGYSWQRKYAESSLRLRIRHGQLGIFHRPLKWRVYGSVLVHEPPVMLCSVEFLKNGGIVNLGDQHPVILTLPGQSDSLAAARGLYGLCRIAHQPESVLEARSCKETPL